MNSSRPTMAGRAVAALGAVLISLSAGTAARAQAVGPGTWTMKAPMPEGVRGEVAAVVFENKLYAIGGNVDSNAVPRNEVYDPATDRWRSLAPMPVARDHLGLALVNGRIYTFGGFVKTVHEGAGTDVFEYDPASNTWRARAPLKSPLGSVGVAVIDNKIHVFGGRGLDKVTTTTHSVYAGRQPTSGAMRRRCPRAATIWRWWRPRAKSTSSAAASREPRRPHRHARNLRSGDRQLEHGGAAQDPAQRGGGGALSGHDRAVDGGEWPPENRTFTEERRLRSQVRRPLGVARPHAARQPRLWRRR